MITTSKIFEVYEDKAKYRLYTKNLVPGTKVYDEFLLTQQGVEYREWDPHSSKIAAAIMNNCPNIFIRKNDVILYLGSASGTTVSHVSDMVGSEGLVFAVDVAPVVMRQLMLNCSNRKNIVPILADANHETEVMPRICQADLIFQDIAQKNQVAIFLTNFKLFVKQGGYGILAVKARSINVAIPPKQIFAQVRAQLENNCTIVDSRSLEPFQKDHMLYICKKQ